MLVCGKIKKAKERKFSFVLYGDPGGISFADPYTPVKALPNRPRRLATPVFCACPLTRASSRRYQTQKAPLYRAGRL